MITTRRDMMEHNLVYRHQRERRPEWQKITLGILGGVLYIVIALAIMQIAVRIWMGTW